MTVNACYPRRTPYAALLWSALMPGFGQLYNRDFLIGAALLVMEFGVNSSANLNYFIERSFNLRPVDMAGTHLQWMMFYPGIWSYAMWQAYNRARELNCGLDGDSNAPAQFTGLFVGLTVFMQFGVIWPVVHSPVMTGLLVGALGAGMGHFLEKLYSSGRNKPAVNAQFHQFLATMRHLYSLSDRQVNQEDQRKAMEEILSTAIQLSGADMGNIQLFDELSGTLTIKCHRGFGSDFLNFFARVHEDQSPCGLALSQRRRIIIEDVAHSSYLAGTPTVDALLAAGVWAVQSTPLVSRTGRLVGMLNTHYRKVMHEGELDLCCIDLLASQAACFIDHAKVQ